jgi:tetratricopeptide (TPR) repeat protein
MATIQDVLTIAVQHHRAGRLAQATELYRRIIEVDARNVDALNLLAQAERHAGNLEGALALFRQAADANPGIPELHVNAAAVFAAAGQVDGAVAAYRRALALNPALAPALQGLGSFLCSQGGSGRLPDAIAALTRASAVDPTRPETLHDLGVALRYAERLDEAIASQWRAIALKPDFAIAFMAQANFVNEQGDRDLGLACIRRAMALAPDVAAIYYNHGNIQNTRGEAETALAMYRRAVRLGMPNAMVRVATVLIDLGRLAEAEAELRVAVRTPGSEIGTAINLLTRIFLQQKRLEEGMLAFAEMGRNPPLTGVSYVGECLTAIATLQLAAGQTHEASRLLARVVGDSSQLFTIKSIAAFRVTLDGLGVALPRPPAPDPALPRISSSTLATHGRFAHNALEYVLLRLYAEKYGCVLETPEWVGGYYFSVDDPLPSRPLRPLYFPRRVMNRLVEGNAPFPPVAECDVLSPLFLFEHTEEYRARVQSWLKPRPLWRPFIEPAVERLRERGDTVVAIHIRRGDFVKFKYPLTETAWYVEWLRGLWGDLKNPVLYVASDDLDGVRRDFAAFNPLTRGDLADDWAGLEFLQDFHVLASADVVGISAASGYSLLAARLNTTARLFGEPDMDAGRIRPFAPWTA